MSKHAGKKFQQLVPTYNYSKIYNDWWYKTLDGIPDVCWPGVIKYFALSSGTSEASSKYIPITKELIRSNTITSFKQLLSLTRYDNVPRNSIGKGWLMLGYGVFVLGKSARLLADIHVKKWPKSKYGQLRTTIQQTLQSNETLSELQKKPPAREKRRVKASPKQS